MPTQRYIDDKFGKMPDIAEANRRALMAGYNYGETTEAFTAHYTVPKAKLQPGTYRSITGNQALAWGLMAAAQRSNCELFLGSYPITPASDILHELTRYKNFGVRTFQAEDEIAAMTSAIGASFGGAMAVTTSSGPGIALKQEAIGLAVMTELPVLIINVQRGGPSTGLAHQDRTGRFAAGDVRPQWRMPRAGVWRPAARATALRSCRKRGRSRCGT